MTTTAYKSYIYKRKDGGTTYCYGEIEWDSNFNVVCDDEYSDGIWADRDPELQADWESICSYLEQYWNDRIEEIESC